MGIIDCIKSSDIVDKNKHNEITNLLLSVSVLIDHLSVTNQMTRSRSRMAYRKHANILLLSLISIPRSSNILIYDPAKPTA